MRQLSVRVGGVERAVETITPSHEHQTSFEITVGRDDGVSFEGVDHVDLILRPDRAVAERSVDVLEIWDGEVVFKDVPLVRDERN